MDAALVASAQRVEHYEMAMYGTLVAWARTMGHDEAADLLQEILDEEKAADEKLTDIAEGGINDAAAAAAHPQYAEAADTGSRAAPQRSKSRAGARKKTASKR